MPGLIMPEWWSPWLSWTATLNMYVQVQADKEDKDDEDRVYTTTVPVLTLALGWKNQDKCTSVNTICCVFILSVSTPPQSPGENSVATIWTSCSDCTYITTMGFDIVTFKYVLEQGFTHWWDNFPIPWTKTNMMGASRLTSHLLDAGALCLTLLYLNSTMHEISLQQILHLFHWLFCITPPLASKS